MADEDDGDDDAGDDELAFHYGKASSEGATYVVAAPAGDAIMGKDSEWRQKSALR